MVFQCDDIRSHAAYTVNDVHPCEKVMGLFFQNQVWARSQEIDGLCLTHIKDPLAISKYCYQQELSDDLLKTARCQCSDIKLGRQVTKALELFDYKMHIFT